MRVIAFDTSLQGTGLADLRVSAGGEGQVWRLGTAGSTSGGAAPDDYAAMANRLFRLTQRIVAWFGDVSDVDVAVIEGPAYAATGGKAHDRAGLWWLVYDRLVRLGLGSKILVAPPGLRAIYATGNGNAAKEVVMAAAIRRYPALPITNNNEADAGLMCAMVARMLGEPVEESLPKTHLRAITTLTKIHERKAP